MNTQVNLTSGRQRRALGMRILDRIRRTREGVTFRYAPLNGLDQAQLDNGFKEVGTPRRCECQKPVVRQRLTETSRGIDRSTRVFVCGSCE